MKYNAKAPELDLEDMPHPAADRHIQVRYAIWKHRHKERPPLGMLRLVL